MYRNSPPLCTIVLQIPSLMPLKMRKVQPRADATPITEATQPSRESSAFGAEDSRPKQLAYAKPVPEDGWNKWEDEEFEGAEGLDILGCVDILVMMLVCQMLSCQQNNGTGFSISCVAAPACMSVRKRIASDLSRLCYGLTAPAPNGGCFRPNTGIGTVSINDSPVGLTKASGNRCCNISPATRTWNT